MPKILVKDLFIEIRHSLGRFLSITLIVALGVAFYSGIKASAPDMKHSADVHFDESNTQDIQLYSTLGIDEEDLEQIRKLSGVEQAEGIYTMDALTHLDSKEQVVKVISWSDAKDISTPRLIDGRMPEKENECLLEASTALSEMFGSLNIGDTISLYSGTDTPLSDDLNNTSYTITGTAYNPNYLSYEKGTSSIGSGSVDTFIYVPEQNFKSEYFTEADITVAGAKALDTYSDAYFELTDPVMDELEALSSRQLDARIASLQKELDDQKKEAYDKLDEAKDKLDDTKVQLEDAKKQIEDAKKQLDEAKSKLDSGQNELANGESNLNQAYAQIQNGLSQIAANESKLASSKAELDSGWAQYYEGKKQADDGLAQVNEGIAQIEEAQKSLPELEKNKQDLQSAADSLASLSEAKSGLENLQAARTSLQGQLDALKKSDPENEQIPALEKQIAEVDAQIAAVASNFQAADAAGALQKIDASIAAVTSKTGDAAAIAASISQIDQGIAQINESVAKLPELQEQKKQLESAETALAQTYQTLAQAQAQYDSGSAQLQDARNQTAAAQSQYQSGLNELEASRTQLAQGQKEYDEGKSTLDEKTKEYEDGLAKYEEGLKEYNENKEKADQEFEDAQKKIDDLDGEWIVLDRTSHYSYRDYESCADRMDGIASVFPVFFFLVAALVCMTTMTRMVAEQRTDIGTLKALGYSKAQIAFKYLAYAGIASIIGCILGCGLGMLIFPWVIFYAWNTMYNLEQIYFLFPIDLILTSSLSVTGIVLAATLFSIYRELMEVPSQLMRPKAQKAGKKIMLEHIPWLWSRLSFMHKVTLRNLFRDKKRFLMTIIGIAGCSALLVAGFGLNDSISDIVPRQFDEIYHYDAAVTASSDKDSESQSSKKQEEILDELKNLDGVSEVYESEQMPIEVNFDSKDIAGYLNIIEDPDSFKDFMTFIPMKDSSADLKLDDEGVLISIKTAEKMNLSVGDTIEFKMADDQKIQAKVSGIFDQYIDHQIYVTRSLFDTWNVKEKPNISYLLINDSTDSEFEDKLGTELMNIDGVKSVTFYSSIAANFLDMISAIKSVVVVLVLSAAMLAFVVLYNLSNVNISERQREIATIKVLGFTEKETNQYINRETLILSAIGALLGLLIGIYLHGMIMSLAELDTIRFGRTILWSSFALSFILTMVFTFFINWIMKFKLRKIEMVESLKAVE